MLVRERALQSDVATPLMAAGASVKLASPGGTRCGNRSNAFPGDVLGCWSQHMPQWRAGQAV